MDRLQGPVVLPCTQAATFSMMAGLPDTQPMRYLVCEKCDIHTSVMRGTGGTKRQKRPYEQKRTPPAPCLSAACPNPLTSTDCMLLITSATHLIPIHTHPHHSSLKLTLVATA